MVLSPNNLIFLALERYGVDPLWINVIRCYYCGIWSRSFSHNTPSGWYQHFRGIFTGCTASIILFLAAINIAIEFICAEATSQNSCSPPVKAFMDDLFLKAKTQEEAQNLLNRASFVLSWARMKVKPSKSRCLIIENGKVQQDKFLSIFTSGKLVNVILNHVMVTF